MLPKKMINSSVKPGTAISAFRVVYLIFLLLYLAASIVNGHLFNAPAKALAEIILGPLFFAFPAALIGLVVDKARRR